MQHLKTVLARNFVLAVIAVVSIIFLTIVSIPSAQAALTGGVKVTNVVKNGTANPSDFTLQIKFGNSTVSGSGNTIIFSGLTAGNTYTITKTEGPAGYSVVWSGDCSSQGTVLIVPNITRNCTATHVFGPVGILKVNVVVIGGTALPTDFTVHLKKSGEPDTGSPSGSGSVVTFSDLAPGDYKVIQSPLPLGYTLSWSGACDADGDVTVRAGRTVTCTATNTFSAQSDEGSGRTDRSPRRAPR